MIYYSAIRQDNGKWAVARYTDTGSVLKRTRNFGVPDRKRCIVQSGLTKNAAIARAAKLNGSHAIAKKQPVRPRRRVGVRAS